MARTPSVGLSRSAKCHPFPETSSDKVGPSPDPAPRPQEDPILDLVIPPPICLRSSPSPPPPAGGGRRLLDTARAAGGGRDLSALRLPPQFNLPKSQLQLYAESVCCCSSDLLGACTAALSPLERMVAVVRWHLSTTRPPPFGKAPYNPVRGETCHVSVGSLNVLLEQVSHNPPVAALYGTNEERGLRLLWWHRAVPRFAGNGVEVAVQGRRLLHLSMHDETYELTSPSLLFRFLPVPASQWVGTTTISCKQSGLEAVVEFKARGLFGGKASNKVEGHISVPKGDRRLLEFRGRWDESVTFTVPESKKEYRVVDCAAAITDVPPLVVTRPKELATTDSVVVWNRLTRSIVSEAWGEARRAKAEVEISQRQRQKQDGGATWAPKYFVLGADGNWVWREPEKAVPPAPVRVQGRD